jgi:hypothetical protein
LDVAVTLSFQEHDFDGRSRESRIHHQHQPSTFGTRSTSVGKP